MLLWLEVFLSFVSLWLLSVVLAAADKFLTVADMHSHGAGFERGIPLDGHIAMKYLDALPFPMLMATWVALHGHQWTRWQIAGFAIAGLILSGVMHLSYIEGGKKFPELVTYGGKLSWVGWEHVVYMGYGFAIVGLGYWCSTQVEPWLVYLSTAYLIAHVTIGVQVIHKIWAPYWFPYHGIWDAGTLVPVAGTAVILTGFSWFALR